MEHVNFQHRVVMLVITLIILHLCQTAVICICPNLNVTRLV